jgi:penicillin V acylase-like amidase (Ntn superfamily)
MKTLGAHPFSTLLVSLSVLVPSAAWPCTTFLAQHDGQPVVGKDYDWSQNAGLVVSNPRGLKKTALTLAASDTPLSWTAKYASLTFNQYGVEFPNGGLNDQGLTIELMWLDSTVYPAADNRPAVNELQWIQYALDEFATVAELVTMAPTIRVSPTYANVHYLVCDATSDCGAFEYLYGDLTITRGSDMIAKTLTNDTYADSAKALATFQGFGGELSMPTSQSSLDRFARASIMAKNTQGSSIPASAFEILDSVSQPNWTVWSIVYVPRQKAIHFRTTAMPKVKTVRLDGFALDCPATRKALDIDSDLTGDVTDQFVDYTSALDRQLLARSMSAIASNLPAGVIDLVSVYPDTCSCVPPTTSTGAAGTSASMGGTSASMGGTSTGAGTGGNTNELPSNAAGNSATGTASGEAGSDGGCNLSLMSSSNNALGWLLALGFCALSRLRLDRRQS